MALCGFLRQSTAVTIKLGPFVDDTDGKTDETALTLTQADIRLAKNSGDMAQKNDATACTHDELGMYDCPLNTTDTNTLGVLTITVHEAGALPLKQEYMVMPAQAWDSLYGADKLQVDLTERLGTAPLALSSQLVQTSTAALQANVITATAIAANAFTAAKFAAGALDAVWTVTTRELTGFSTALALSVWHVLESAIVTASTIGLKLKTNVDATISSRSTYAGTDTAGTTTLLSRIIGTLATGTHSPQSGDSFTRLGAPVGASHSADVAAVQADTDNLQTRLPAALVSGRMDASVGAYPGNTPQTGDSFARLGAPVGASHSADVAAVKTDTAAISAAVDTEVAAIKAKTDQLTFTTANKLDATIQAAGDFAQAAADKAWATTTRVLTAGTNIVLAKGTGITGFNDLSAAQVNTEVDTALTDVNLDHLVGTASGIPAIPSGTYLDQVMDDGTATYDRTTDSLQAIRDRGDTAWGGGSAPTAAQVADAVWDEALSGHLAGGSAGAALNGAGSAGDPWTTSLPGAYGAGTAGNILGSNLNATVSSRATQTSVDDLPTNAELSTALASADDATLAAIAAVQADTDNIQTRLPAALVSGRMDASVGAYPGNTPQTGDTFARLGAPVGASVSADVASVQSDTNDLQTRLPTTLDTGRIRAVAEVVGDKTGYALTTAERQAIANALLDLADAIEAGKNVRTTLQAMAAVLAGDVTGAGTATESFRALGNAGTTRVTVPVDPSGNRTGVTVS